MGSISKLEYHLMDEHTSPADDLFAHVNGRWLAETEIPSDRARWGSFDELRERALEALRAILEGADEADEELTKCRLLYRSFMDEETIEARGLNPLTPVLGQVDAVDSLESAFRLLGALSRWGVGGFVHAFVDADPGNPERYLAFLVQGGISLPDERYFREEDFEGVRQAYLSHLRRMHELAGLERPDERAQLIFALEQELASHHWDNVRSRDALATYNLASFEDAVAMGLPLDAWAEGAGIPEDKLAELVICQPSFLEDAAKVLRGTPIDTIRTWITWKMLHASAPYLGAALVEENFAFYGRTLTGATSLSERWKRGVGFVEGAMGEALGKAYVARHFPPAAKDRMETLVAHLLEAYRQRISTLAWMTPATRERALAKLAKLRTKIGYPTVWKDYSLLEVRPDDLFGNHLRAIEVAFERELAKLGGPIDREEWFMTPQTVNAYFNPTFNEIVFPAAILQYPFFDAERDDAENYGGIGTVIGHEIGHAFDDQGSRYDGDGRLENWWTDEDRANFEERTKALIAQYDELSPRGADGAKVNGALTIGENIGDLGGVGIAWVAYQIALDGSVPPVLEGRTGAQRFFLAYAHIWRGKARPEETRRLLAIDPHSPQEFRCNQVVRNVDAYHEAFNVTPAHRMWLDPSARVTIW
jgi:putative endopeptidase